jgi:hypothetical protein
MIFLEGLDRRLWLKGNGLQRGQSQKIGKTQKKVQNNFPDTPVFLQNGPKFRPKTDLDKTHSLQAAPVVRVNQYDRAVAATIRRAIAC